MELNAILSPLGAFGPMIAGVLLLLVIVKLLSNGLCGALLLWFINVVGSLAGFTMKITVIKALIAGFFGVPGALAVVLYELLVK